ncbi:MAG: hypothetical protein FWF69_02635 [Firmicutes bacterium]|nr:hypothetical protein [Bacillota bacterium]
MRKFRAAAMPLVVLAAICSLAYFSLQVGAIAKFDFIWDTLLGAALGVGLALLPALSGFGARRNAYTSMYWLCGFAALLLIFYQYMSTVTGMRIEGLEFLSSPGQRMLIAEATILGFCSVVAGRGKV